MAFIDPFTRTAAAILAQHAPCPVGKGRDEDRPYCPPARHSRAVRQQVSAWRDRRIALRAGRSVGERLLGTCSEVSKEDVAVSQTEREIGERPEVVRDGQIAERRWTSRHPAQRTARDAARSIQVYRPEIGIRAAAEERQASGGDRGKPIRIAPCSQPLRCTRRLERRRRESLPVEIHARRSGRREHKRVVHPRHPGGHGKHLSLAEPLDHARVGRRAAIYRHDPPIRLDRRVRTGMDDHGAAVRQPRHAGHIDHFGRDGSYTCAAAGSHADANSVVRDTREPETVRRNRAAARASLQETWFTPERRDLVHVRPRIVGGGEDDSSVVR